MSDDDAPTAIAEAVNGYDQLEARQVSIHGWRVLSYRNDGLSAHKVNLQSLGCSCHDAQYNREEPEICDHLAVALHRADRKMAVGEALNYELVQQMTELNDHVETIERRAAGVQADAAAETTNTGTDETGDSDADTGDPWAEGDWRTADEDSVPDAVREILSRDYDDMGRFYVRSINDGWQVGPDSDTMDSDAWDEWDDLTGPDGKDAYDPIWPPDYEDGDPPVGTKISEETVNMVEDLIA